MKKNSITPQKKNNIYKTIFTTHFYMCISASMFLNPFRVHSSLQFCFIVLLMIKPIPPNTPKRLRFRSAPVREKKEMVEPCNPQHMNKTKKQRVCGPQHISAWPLGPSAWFSRKTFPRIWRNLEGSIIVKKVNG